VLNDITPLIITYNEQENIRRTLDKLVWARRVVIVDSGSTDQTIEILRGYPQVEIVQHQFVDFAEQCNFGLAQIRTPWTLSLDSDYVLSDALVEELSKLIPADGIAGYRAKFIYRIFGRPLRGSLYPPRTVLYRTSRASYRNEGHGHRVSIDGTILSLAAPIFHDDRKPLARWFESQRRYARLEAQHLLNSDRALLSRTDRLRIAAWPAPFAVFFHTLLVKGCLFDGWPGWFYVLQRVVAEAMIALEIVDLRLRRSADH
jgi:glycosyltransferase involved in cell wall biosynthesis